MLQQQQELTLGQYTFLYDLLVKKDDELRRLHDEVDLSFVYTELHEKYCIDNGRTAVSPIRMFRYLLLKVIYDLSDASVVKRSLTDMSFKYFLDMQPEDTDMIDPSSLCKFRKLRLKDSGLLSMLVGKTISIAKQKGIITRGTIIIDATHTRSRALAFDPVAYLRMRVQRLKHSLVLLCPQLVDSFPAMSKDADLQTVLENVQKIITLVKEDGTAGKIPAAQNQRELLEEALDDVLSRGYVSKDKDARHGHKSATKPFFGTKEHLAVEAESGLVCAAVVSSGEKVDGKFLPDLVEQSRENGVDAEYVVADKAYSTTENLEMADSEAVDTDGMPILDSDGNPKKNFILYSPITRNVSQGVRGNTEFQYNKDAGTMACPAGHLAIRKRYKSRKSERGENPAMVYFFDTDKCKVCPLREGCYRGTKTKIFQQRILSDMHKGHIEFEKTDDFKQHMKVRYKIESKNADLKHNYGLDRAKSYGLKNMTMQTTLSIFACNLKRILRLTATK